LVYERRRRGILTAAQDRSRLLVRNEWGAKGPCSRVGSKPRIMVRLENTIINSLNAISVGEGQYITSLENDSD
jgi:hypothetical protein